MYEWRHLKAKLAARDPEWLARLGSVAEVDSHPLFRVVHGQVEEWEVTGGRRRTGEGRRRLGPKTNDVAPSKPLRPASRGGSRKGRSGS